MPRLYLDHNAGRPPLPVALAAAAETARGNWANPHSAHGEGRAARRVLEDARGRVAELAGRAADQVFFTSGGTEAAHAALTGAARARRETDGRLTGVVISALEHVAMSAAAEVLRREGFIVRTVPAAPDGAVAAGRFIEACTEDTAAAALIAGQNEIGTLQPVQQVAAELSARQLPLVVDAVQLPGLGSPVLPAGAHVLGVLSSHKMGGLAGAGAVVADAGLGLVPFLGGGEQERRRRAGTPALSLVAAMGAAAREMAARGTSAARRVSDLRDRFERDVLNRLDGVQVIGEGTPRLASTSALRLDGVRGEDVVAALDLRGVAISAGAACSVGAARPSAALLALGFTPGQARGLVRVSLGGDESHADIETAVEALVDVVTEARRHARAVGNPA